MVEAASAPGLGLRPIPAEARAGETELQLVEGDDEHGAAANYQEGQNHGDQATHGRQDKEVDDHDPA